MLAGLDGFLYHGWLNANGQSYDDGVDTLAGKEVIEGVGRCSRRVVVYIHRLCGPFGEFLGGCFGARVDSFEGEGRGRLDGREMLYEKDVASA